MKLAAKVTDSTCGRAAPGLAVSLQKYDGEDQQVVHSSTDSCGRASWTSGDPDAGLTGNGIYRIVVEISEYFAALGLQSSYLQAEITLRVAGETADHQVSFLIGPNSCTTFVEN